MMWVLFLFISFWPWEKDAGEVKKTSIEIPEDLRLLRVVRVALFYEKPEILVSVPASYEVKSFPESEPLERGSSLEPVSIRAEATGIRMGSRLYNVSGLRFTSGTREVQVEKKKYRNVVEVLKNPAGSLTVVNEIDVEDYLKGVLPWETNPDWPEEALKTQAVVSRTYAVFKNVENKDFPFSLSSDVGSQVYQGKSIEHPLTDRAVEKTRGEILTYRGKILAAFFHSTCGGRTTRADYQWRVESHPALKGVECPFCQGSKHYRWKAEFSALEVERLLKQKGHSVSGVQAITPEEIDPSGRPHFFVIRHAGGKLSLSANELRLALGPDRMRSTLVRIDKSGDQFFLQGRGWGHGVGLCQFGAKHLAELGYKYRDILRYYYPDSEIRNLTDLVVSRAGAVETRDDEKDENALKRWFGKLKEYVEEL